MAASAVVAEPAPERMAAWSRIRSLSQKRIHEGNAVAGERLWTLTGNPEVTCFTIGHVGPGEEYIECSLDLETWILTCRPGRAREGGVLLFESMAGSSASLRHAGSDRSVEEAVTLILDELVRHSGWEEGEPRS
jgi:hypothetical protein